MVNQAQSWFFLECDSTRADVDKSKEFYLLEVFNADTQELFVNVTSDEPVFQVSCMSVGTKCWSRAFGEHLHENEIEKICRTNPFLTDPPDGTS